MAKPSPMLGFVDTPAKGSRSPRKPLLDEGGGDEARSREGSSEGAAAISFVKAVVGGGIFALPSAVRASGLVLGTGMVLVMAALSWYTTQACIRCVLTLRARGVAADRDGRIEYTHLTEIAFPWVSGPMTFLCVLCQIGSVVSYFAFVAANLTPMCPLLERWHVIAGMACVVGPLALLRSTSHPAFNAAMAFGNVAIVAALASVLYYGEAQAARAPAPPALVAVDASGVGLLFGVSLIMFSAHMEAVSIEQDMARRERVFRVLRRTFVGLTVVFAFFGAAVYALFGEATGRVRDGRTGRWVEATIMNNLEGGLFLQFVQVCLCLNLVFMSPITLLPASKAVEEALGVQPRPGWPDMAPAHAVRLLVVSSVALAAIALPNFELITGVMGSFGAIMCFVIPAACQLKFRDGAMGAAEHALNYGIAALGLGGFVWSLYLQVVQAME